MSIPMPLPDEQVMPKQVHLFLFNSDRNIQDVLMSSFPSNTRAVHQVEACLSVTGHAWLTERLWACEHPCVSICGKNKWRVGLHSLLCRTFCSVACVFLSVTQKWIVRREWKNLQCLSLILGKN